MKKIMQFRYYGSEGKKTEKNYPNNFTSPKSYLWKLTSGNIFDKYGLVTKIGIQCRPNVRFYLNNSEYPIEIGITGIYELDLEGYGYIHSIRFDENSLIIFDSPDVEDRLLIDIVYEGAGAQ